jgi:hypothetical protein
VKLWISHGSEHSMNLVMVGRFSEVQDATDAARFIDELTNQVSDEGRGGQAPDRFSDQVLDLLRASNIYTIAPMELEQLGYEFRVEARGTDVVITTDEVEVSALLKILLDKGARIEVYSAHQHPNTGYGR